MWKEKGYDSCPPSEDAPTRTSEGERIAMISPHSLIRCSLQLEEEKNIEIQALLDTGASKNYISRSFESYFLDKMEGCDFKVKSAFQEISSCTSLVKLKVSFIDERRERLTKETIFYLIDTSLQMIIGKDDIRSWNLPHHFPSLFFDRDVAQTILTGNRGSVSEVGQNCLKGEMAMVPNGDNVLNDWCESDRLRSAFEREDIFEIQDDYLQAIPAEYLQEGISESQLPVEFNGPPELQDALRSLVEEFSERFQLNISIEPARVEPFVLKVDLSKWEIPSNHTGPRRMDKTRESECMRQIRIMLDRGIIQPSRAPFYSHALMVPKSNDKWRFVIDFTKLNLATEKEGWPIPNIELMLLRIGERRPKFFIVLDLTNGYFQIPLSVESRVYTAFLASNQGLFEWLRLPMGLKGAPAFFQRVLSTTVLAGLIGIICELSKIILYR